jgi:murein L,D-transpeptidase YafK
MKDLIVIGPGMPPPMRAQIETVMANIKHEIVVAPPDKIETLSFPIKPFYIEDKKPIKVRKSDDQPWKKKWKK